MENDLSKQLYDKYFNLTNRNITVTLKTGKIITGSFISFFRGDEIWENSYITQWHIVDEKDSINLGIDVFGFLVGEYIKQKDITEVQFHHDNSIMKFNHPKKDIRMKKNFKYFLNFGSRDFYKENPELPLILK